MSFNWYNNYRVRNEDIQRLEQLVQQEREVVGQQSNTPQHIMDAVRYANGMFSNEVAITNLAWHELIERVDMVERHVLHGPDYPASQLLVGYYVVRDSSDWYVVYRGPTYVIDGHGRHDVANVSFHEVVSITEQEAASRLAADPNCPPVMATLFKKGLWL